MNDMIESLGLLVLLTTALYLLSEAYDEYTTHRFPICPNCGQKYAALTRVGPNTVKPTCCNELIHE